MNWLKLFKYDLHCGILRWKYLFVPVVFLMPCILCFLELNAEGIQGTWADYMMYCFKGCKPVSSTDYIQDFSFPTFWLLNIGCVLFLNLDYLPFDLTHVGQQMMIRSNKKLAWFSSKCAWLVTSCMVYLGIGCITVGFFVLATGGDITLTNTPMATLHIFRETTINNYVLNAQQIITLVVIVPIVSIVELCFLEMVMCLLLKPALAFLISLSLLIVASYWNVPLIPGIGAMVIRNDLISQSGISTTPLLGYSVSVIVGTVIVGCLRVKRTDILNMEE